MDGEWDVGIVKIVFAFVLVLKASFVMMEMMDLVLVVFA